MNDFYYKSDSTFNKCLLKWTIFIIKVRSIFNECLLKWTIFTTKVFNIQWMSTKMIDIYYKSNQYSINVYYIKWNIYIYIYIYHRFFLQKNSIFNKCLLKWLIFTTIEINIQWMSTTMIDFYHNRVFNIQWMSTTMIDFYYKSNQYSINVYYIKWNIYVYIYITYHRFLLQKWFNIQ